MVTKQSVLILYHDASNPSRCWQRCECVCFVSDITRPFTLVFILSFCKRLFALIHTYVRTTPPPPPLPHTKSHAPLIFGVFLFFWFFFVAFTIARCVWVSVCVYVVLASRCQLNAVRFASESLPLLLYRWGGGYASSIVTKSTHTIHARS